ncbi:EutN/CcmL family microcompartment protein [Amphibacillus sp. Q70]|uniref:EutN/CcmL family microcompartment protein n=1 Tax=Amphibacillus sp. Q70 TaxID=3453416 RepID=UPI003F830251
MLIGKVVGNIVSTKKEESLTGFKLMRVTLVNQDNQPTKQEIIAVDLVGSGRGEYVLVAQGSSARIASKRSEAPIDASIVGIIDSLEE